MLDIHYESARQHDCSQRSLSYAFLQQAIDSFSLWTTRQRSMKAATLLFALCVGTSRAFCPSNTPVRKTSLNVASVPPEDLDSWSNKPLNSHETTTPVADPKFNAFNRMMMKDVVLSPDYSLTWAVALCGPLIMAYHPCTYIHYSRIKVHNSQSLYSSSPLF